MLSSSRSRLIVLAVGVAMLAIGLAAVALPNGNPSDSGEGTPTDAADDPDTTDAERVAQAREARLTLAAPAFSARDDAGLLRLLLAEAVIGSDRDADRVLEQITEVADRLEATATELEALAAETPASPSDHTEPPPEGLEALHDQALDVATHLRAAADPAAAHGSAALELHGAAARFASAEVRGPDDDDPDVLADGWTTDLELLRAYEAAATTATDHTPLVAHAEAHLEVVTTLIELSETAITHLEDGDLDAYNAVLEQRFADVDPLVEELVPSLEQSLQATVSDAEAAEGRVLGLLSELEGFRTSTPPPS